MSFVLENLFRYGYPALFAYLIVSRLGVPIPSTPVTLAAGALVASGHLQMTATIATVAFAFLCADGTWYALGRKLGERVIHLFCRISWEPESCLQKAGSAMDRYGAAFLLIEKFLPVVGPMSSAAAGQSRMHFARYAAFDAAGATVWAGTYVVLGRFLGTRLGSPAVTAPFGVALLAASIVGVVAYRRLRQRRLH